jgi:hypothetical protein
VAFISYRRPAVDGDGGNHRTHQILFDLQTEFGDANVWSLSLEGWISAGYHGVAPAGHRLRRLRRRAARTFENPYKLFTREAWSHNMRFGTRGVLAEEFIGTYFEGSRAMGGFDACVVDHPMFDQIRAINRGKGVPTVITSHNLESLDVSRLQLNRRLQTQAAGIDLANELHALAGYDERLAISKVEASLLTGIGLSCRYYPFVPRGELRAALARIASERRRGSPEPDLFVVLGTANHAPTKKSMAWFLDNARTHGLPQGARVVVVGDKVAELAEARHAIPGIDVRGRVSQAELADLLVRAGCALVTQRMGFGALTRLPELACAGVPTLVFPHASFAIDPPPGVHVLPDASWAATAAGMSRTMQSSSQLDEALYRCWEERAARPLGEVVGGLARC